MPLSTSEKADVITTYLLQNGPTRKRDLLERTNTDQHALHRATQKYMATIVPMRYGRSTRARTNYRAEELIGGMANQSERIVLLEGQELHAFELIKECLPSRKAYQENVGLRNALCYYFPHYFSERLTTLFYYHYENKTGIRKMPIELVLQHPLVIERCSDLMVGKGGLKADVILTSRESGIRFASAVAEKMKVKLVVCDKIESDGVREISLERRDERRKLRGKSVLRADDFINSKSTMKRMADIVEDSGGQNVGMAVQVVNEEHNSMTGLDYLCSLPTGLF